MESMPTDDRLIPLFDESRLDGKKSTECFVPIEGESLKKEGPSAVEVGHSVKRALAFDYEGDGLSDEDGHAKDSIAYEIRDSSNQGNKRRKQKMVGISENETKKTKGHRKENKGRKERLKELRAESQRLLRDTKNVSFNQTSCTAKPISLLLDKIRQRKMEFSKRYPHTCNIPTDDNDSADARETVVDSFQRVDHRQKLELEIAEVDRNERNACFMDATSCSSPVYGERTEDEHIYSSSSVAIKAVLDEDSRISSKASLDDIQELEIDSDTLEAKEDMEPSTLAQELKNSFKPLDDFSSDEEDNNKENIDPILGQSSEFGDPVKAFIDEEAEEEDDSDGDKFYFDDDEDASENELELNDLIAPEYEEKPVDDEMRNQLHQKWLEQQDATGTENLLQKLSFYSKDNKMHMFDEQDHVFPEDEETHASDMEFRNSRENLHINLKKAKEMIPQMFTDKDDVYISDEEIDMTHTKQLILDSEEHSMLLSPAEDEVSREMFGLIKKVNVAHDTKKTKITSYFHASNFGRSDSSSKSSFVGRVTKNVAPSFQKQGSSASHSFIFERDDSNSRTTLSFQDELSNMVQEECKTSRPKAAKFSRSQIKSFSQVAITEHKPSPSLHEVLKGSLHSNNSIDGVGHQVEALYASFKLDRNHVRKAPNSSVRTF